MSKIIKNENLQESDLIELPMLLKHQLIHFTNELVEVHALICHLCDTITKQKLFLRLALRVDGHAVAGGTFTIV